MIFVCLFTRTYKSLSSSRGISFLCRLTLFSGTELTEFRKQENEKRAAEAQLRSADTLESDDDEEGLLFVNAMFHT